MSRRSFTEPLGLWARDFDRRLERQSKLLTTGRVAGADDEAIVVKPWGIR